MGYPAEDLLLRQDFFSDEQKALQDLQNIRKNRYDYRCAIYKTKKTLQRCLCFTT